MSYLTFCLLMVLSAVPAVLVAEWAARRFPSVRASRHLYYVVAALVFAAIFTPAFLLIAALWPQPGFGPG